jgi:hypothetical protein
MKGRYLVPDAIEPVVGWRAWQPYGMGALISPLYISAWPWREPFKAACFGKGHHRAPVKSCECGIYIAKDLQKAGQYGCTTIGKVYGWGKVVEHRLGWRVQYAYPKEIYTIQTEEEAFSGYGVPVYRVSEKEMRDLAGPDWVEQAFLKAWERVLEEAS